MWTEGTSRREGSMEGGKDERTAGKPSQRPVVLNSAAWQVFDGRRKRLARGMRDENTRTLNSPQKVHRGCARASV